MDLKILASVRNVFCPALRNDTIYNAIYADEFHRRAVIIEKERELMEKRLVAIPKEMGIEIEEKKANDEINNSNLNIEIHVKMTTHKDYNNIKLILN